MNHLKMFEEYSSEMHNIINMSRKVQSNKILNKLLKIISLIDDLIHLDFKNIKNTLKNKIGYEKSTKLISELSLIVQAMRNEKFNKMDFFYDIRKYGFDIDMIINYLEDNNVKEYIKNDRRLKKTLETEYDEVIDFLRDYKNWNDNNRRMFK